MTIFLPRTAAPTEQGWYWASWNGWKIFPTWVGKNLGGTLSGDWFDGKAVIVTHGSWSWYGPLPEVRQAASTGKVFDAWVDMKHG